MSKTYYCFLLVVFAIIAFAGDALAWGDDWYVSAANYARYYHFKETRTDSAATRFQYDVYMGNFYLGGWYEAKHEMKETGSSNATFSDFTQRYIGWEDRGLTIHAGTFYEVYDRGLALNTFRDDEVSVDLVLDGVKLNMRNKYLDFDALSAVQEYASLRTVPLSSATNIRGARAKIKPLNMFHLGGAYVSYINNSSQRQNINQLNARFLWDYVDIYAEAAERQFNEYSIFAPDSVVNSDKGDAVYINASGFYSYFTALFEYKNYWDMLYPASGVLNTPPAVNKQDRLLKNETSNVFESIRGEHGFRFNLNGSLNDYWGAQIDYSEAKSRGPDISKNDELFAEIRGNFLDDKIVFAASIDLFSFSWDTYYDSAWIDTSFTMLEAGPVMLKRNEFRPEIEFEYRFDDLRAIEIDASLLQYNYEIPAMPNDLPDTLFGVPTQTHYMVDSTNFAEKNLSITFSQSPNIRVTVGGSLSDRDPSPDPEKMGFIEVSYIWENHELIVFQGQQRGGLVCSGGVCVFHPTFEGVRVTLLSRL